MAHQENLGGRTGEDQGKKTPNQKHEEQRRGPQSDRQDQGNKSQTQDHVDRKREEKEKKQA